MQEGSHRGETRRPAVLFRLLLVGALMLLSAVVHDAGITPYLLMFVRFQVVTDERYLPNNTAPLYSWGASCT